MTDPKYRNVAVLSMLILLIATALVAVSATAGPVVPGHGDPVSGAEDVQWRELSSQAQLFLTREDETQRTDIGSAESNLGGGIGQLSTERQQTESAEGARATQPITHFDAFVVDDALEDEITALKVARFQTDELTKDVQIKGGNVMSANVHVVAAPQLQWTWKILECPDATSSDSQCTTVGEDTFVPNQGPTPIEGYRPNFTLSRTIPFSDDVEGTSYTFQEDHHVRFTMTAETGPDLDLEVVSGETDALVGTRGIWLLRREGPTGEAPHEGASNVIIDSQNSLEVAGWITDHESRVSDLFSNSTDEKENELDAHFAVRSAFGFDDVDDIEPTFQLERFNPETGENETVLMDPGKNSSVVMEEDPGRQIPDLGQSGWTLPDKYWDYHEAPTGEYKATMSGTATFRPEAQGGPSAGLDAQWEFRITDQEVELSMFPEDEASHLIHPGSSTTFLVEVENTGTTEDTFDLSVRAPQAAQAGWRSEIDAANLDVGNELDLKSGEETLVRVTVHAPDDVAIDDSQAFTLNATSAIDVEASDELTLVATASDEVRHGVGIIGGEDDVDITLGPKDNGTATLFAWNNATVVNDLRVALQVSQDLDNWNASLVSQGLQDDSFTLQGVAPGDVAAIDVKFRTKGDLPSPSHAAVVNATVAGEDIEAEVDIVAEVELADSVNVEVLDAIDGLRRYMEMECQPGLCPTDSGIPTVLFATGERDPDRTTTDGLEQTLVRTWITNTGDETREFELKISDRRKETTLNDIEPYRCDRAFRPIDTTIDPDTQPSVPPSVPGVPSPSDFSATQQTCALEMDGTQPDALNPPTILRKFSDNSTSSINTVQLRPDETAEVYVRVEHRADATSYAPSDFEFSVVAECVPDDCAARGQDDVEIRGDNGVKDKSHVLVEPVAREPGYNDASGAPLVNLTDRGDDPVRRFIAPGEESFKDYRVRVTHGASFPQFFDGPGDPDNHKSKVKVSLSGVNTQDGWDAELLPLTGSDLEAQLENPQFVDSYTFDNCNPSGCPSATGYQDVEFLVRVHAPDPDEHDPVAGDQTSAIVRAEGIGLGDTDILSLETEILPVPKLNITAGSTNEFVQAGERTGFLVNLENEASAAGTFAFSARTPDGYSASPTFGNFTIDAQSERSLDLKIRADEDVQIGENVSVVLKGTWEDPRRDFSKEDLRCTEQGIPANEDAPVACERVFLEVVEEGTVSIRADETGTTLKPGAQHTYSFEVANTDENNERDVVLDLVSPPEWDAQLSRSSFTGDNALEAEESRSVNLIVTAPSDVIEGSSHGFIVKAHEQDDERNVDIETFTADIIEGQGRPVVEVDENNQLVERGDFVHFNVEVENRGTAEDTFPLRVDGPSAKDWSAHIEHQGRIIEELQLRPNEQTRVVVNVSAPFEDVSDGTVVKPSIIAFDSGFQTKSEATLITRIQDYGVSLSIEDTHVQYIPGTERSFRYTVQNTGNGNDTLNVSMDLQGLDDTWTVTFDEPRVRLEPDEKEEIKATIKSPRNQLPSPRSVTFTAWAGTVQGAAVEEWQNRSIPFVVEILDYRTQDIDEDGYVEIAVDTQPETPNSGYAHYREIFPEGKNSTLRASFDADRDDRPDFLVDDPGDTGIDGIADVYWDPDDIVVYRIEHKPDATFDSVPDYLIDADGDDTPETFWNGGNRTLGDVDAINVLGDADDDREQYVMDTFGDGEFDKFYDPATGVISEVEQAPGQGANVIGLDTTGDGDVDTFYDTEDETVSTAAFHNAGQFAQDYWYLVILFGLVLLVGIVAVTRRR